MVVEHRLDQAVGQAAVDGVEVDHEVAGGLVGLVVDQDLRGLTDPEPDGAGERGGRLGARHLQVEGAGEHDGRGRRGPVPGLPQVPQDIDSAVAGVVEVGPQPALQRAQPLAERRRAQVDAGQDGGGEVADDLVDLRMDVGSVVDGGVDQEGAAVGEPSQRLGEDSHQQRGQGRAVRGGNPAQRGEVVGGQAQLQPGEARPRPFGGVRRLGQERQRGRCGQGWELRPPVGAVAFVARAGGQGGQVGHVVGEGQLEHGQFGVRVLVEGAGLAVEDLPAQRVADEEVEAEEQAGGPAGQ